MAKVIFEVGGVAITEDIWEYLPNKKAFNWQFITVDEKGFVVAWEKNPVYKNGMWQGNNETGFVIAAFAIQNSFFCKSNSKGIIFEKET